MAGYQPSQNGIYISPDAQIPPGMTDYPMQPPTIPRQQQQMSNPLPQQQIGNFFMPPPPPPQYRHHTTASGPPPSNYPYPPQPTQLPPSLQQQQFRNNGSTTVMLPVTFTPGMAPVIHSAAATNTAGIQQRQPQFHGPTPPMNNDNDRYTMNTTTERGGNASGGGGGGGSGSAGVAASPRYLSIGNPPPSMLPHHPFASQTHPSAGQMWQGGVPGAPPPAAVAAATAVAMGRMSPPHPLTYAGQDFQATMPSVGVTGPLQIPRIQAHQQQTPAAVGRVSPPAPAAFQQPPLPPPLQLVRPEEQSGDSAPRRSYPSSGEHGAVVARKRAQPFNNHGFKSQNNDLAEDTLEIPLPSALVTAAVARPVSVPKMHNTTAHEMGIEALVEAATAADPEVSRASRSSARQQRNKKLNQNEVLLLPPGGGGSGERPKGGPGNASEKLRRELGAALLGGDAGGAAVVGPPPVFQQQQQPTVPSSVLQNLSRALADLSRMTAGTTPAVEATAEATAMMPPPPPTNRTRPLPPVQLPLQLPPPPSSQIPPAVVASPPGKSLQRKKNSEKDHGGEHGGKGKAAPLAGATTTPTATKSKSTTEAPPPPPPAEDENEEEQEEEKEEIEVVVPDNKLCPACGKTFIHRSSKTRHMKNCKAVALGLVYKAPRKKKKAASKKKKKPKEKPSAPEQPAAPSPPPLPEPPALVAPVQPAPPPPRPSILAPFIIPTIPQTLTRPANGNRVSQPLKPEKIYFGPGIFFPRPLKRKRSNIFKKIGPFGGSSGSGGAMPNSGFYGQQRFMVQQQQQQQQPPPYYFPMRPPPPPPSLQNFRPAFGAPYNSHQQPQHPQPQYPLFPTAANAGGGAGAAICNQGPTATLMHLPQQNRSGRMPPSLANNMMYPPFPTMATTTTHQHIPLSSPQPAPPRLQRSAVAATRAEPMVRIVREISSTSQLQRLQIDAKMERSLLLPPVIPSSSQQQQVTAKTTTTTTTTREEGPDSAAAAAAVAVGSNTQQQQQQQNKQQRNQESPYPDEFTPLFKFNLTIIDESDQAWQVTYEGLACSGQRHVRLSSGWHALMKGVGVIPGDKVVLERWTDDRTVLHMLVLEGNEEQRAAAAVSGAHVRATSRVNLQEERGGGGRNTRENTRTGPRTRN